MNERNVEGDMVCDTQRIRGGEFIVGHVVN